MQRKRYAVVGTGGRSSVFLDALAGPYRESAELVGLCDVSPTRMEYHNKINSERHGLPPRPTYPVEKFEQMIREQKPDVVIVTTPDYLHHEYAVRAMKAGCDVLCEKPLTTDAGRLRAIFDAIEATGRKLRVTFNVRYMPEMAAVKKLVLDGAVGTAAAVDLSWTLDTGHGADYFRRWHREKDKSGGLLIHKATHHFDMVNWWVDSYPQRVFAMGDLKFYGRKNAEARGVKVEHDRYTGKADPKTDPFAFSLQGDAMQEGLYLNAEKDSGYIRDRNVFGDNITIEDTAILSVKYRSGVLFNYSLIAFSPWEGLRVAITGTAGRVELYVRHSAHLHNVPEEKRETAQQACCPMRSLRVYPMFGLPYDVEIAELAGSHGGSDALMLAHLFSPNPKPDPLGQAASHIDGAASSLIGISANESMSTGMPVDCDKLLKLPEKMAAARSSAR